MVKRGGVARAPCAPAKAGPPHAIVAAAEVVRGGASGEVQEAAAAGGGVARSLLTMEVVEAGEPVGSIQVLNVLYSSQGDAVEDIPSRFYPF